MWRHTVQIKDLLSHENVTPEAARELGQLVANRILRAPLRNHLALATGFQDVQDQDDFNDCMTRLYNDADRERVWIA